MIVGQIIELCELYVNKPLSNNEKAYMNQPDDRRFSKKGPVKTRRLWLYRFLTILLVPALTLGLLELVLAVSGYGYPTRFFVKSRVEGQEFLIPNAYFSYRFFPPHMARTAANYRFPADKAPGVYRIFVLGESAALGVPDWSYGVSRYLDVLLDQRYPETEFEVICVAMTAINSHVILPIAREIAGMDGDLWVIYMGNNEMVGPFGAGTIFGGRAPGRNVIRAGLALKKTRTGQLLAGIASRPGSGSEVPDQWEGINMFKNNLLRHDDPARLRAYRNFEGNLKDILEIGQEAGIPIILSTVGSNLKDCSPFASLHREGLETSSKWEWDTLFQEGLELEKKGQYEEALSRYRDAAEIDPEHAELQFRIGTCQLALGDVQRARPVFERARDYDALPVRADTRINRILMDSVPESEGRVLWVDAAEALAEQSPEGIPGREMFYEHVHFTIEGNFALARIIADQVSALLPADILESRTENWAKNDACNRLLALTVWDQVRLWQLESERVNKMPYISQTSNPLNKSHIENQMKAIKMQIRDGLWEQDNQLYTSALAQAPDDTFLVVNYAQFLAAARMNKEAVRQAERFCALLPDLAWPHFYLAKLQKRAGMQDEARESLKKALEVRSDFAEARELLKQLR
jgi:tetratricopeptide (TPR) repeat protein